MGWPSGASKTLLSHHMIWAVFAMQKFGAESIAKASQVCFAPGVVVLCADLPPTWAGHQPPARKWCKGWYASVH
jgi:hypothetical protein